MAAMEPSDYYENIGIRNLLLWIVLIGLVLLFSFSSVAQIVLGISVGDHPMPNWALIVGTLFTAFITVLMAQTRLSLEINRETIQLNFGVLGQHHLKWSEVKQVQVSKVPISGIGKRQRGPQEIIYNVGAKTALKLDLKDGRTIWASTRQASNLKDYLKGIKKLKA